MAVWELTEEPAEAKLFEDVVVFFKVNEAWGGLSNMSNAYPLTVQGMRIKSSEALYQALRFPHQSAWQAEILAAPHAMAAKMKAKKDRRRAEHSREDWPEIQLAVMRWVLGVKLTQHPHTFGRLLQATGTRAIVEQSRRDDFWGAKLNPANPRLLVGRNVLGRLLMEWREKTWQIPNPTPLLEDVRELPELSLLGQVVAGAQAASQIS